MPDVIVLVPGILGSVLVKDGREVWGASGESVAGTLGTFGRALRSLQLAPGVAHGDPGDGVSAPRLLPSMRMLPRFWKADGYGRLAERLATRFSVSPPTPERPGNLLAFPYDWRLSNELTAQRLAGAVIPCLERWRRHTQNSDAKLILICHSMGGLVARWFLEKLGGREHTRMLITIGTPYQGSVKALESIVNGLFLGKWSIGIALDTLVRSFPSVYQLLPTYPCLDLGDGQLRALAGLDLPNADTVSIDEGLAFHARIAAALEPTPRYQTIAIKGLDQPTSQSALLRGGKVEPRRSHRNTDYGGDGTVPRPSAHPPEWRGEDEGSVFVPQTHAMLQSTDSVLTQIFGMLTGHLGRFMGGARIGVDVPDLVELGSPLHIGAVSPDGDPDLPLLVVCQREDGQAFGEPGLMRATGDGRYVARIVDLPAGAFKITVQSATPARPVEPVSDFTFVLDPQTA
jgi:hypothetical protein